MKNKILNIAVLASLLSFAPIATAYANASEIDEEQTEFMAEFQPKIVVNGNNVHVLNASGMTLEIYNITGVLVASYKIESAEKVISLNLPKSWYILKVGKMVTKFQSRN